MIFLQLENYKDLELDRLLQKDILSVIKSKIVCLLKWSLSTLTLKKKKQIKEKVETKMGSGKY